ncbi:unnamed protein product [Linum trigynum]|uniref:Uncharacterized protein n=1 Tax=Linum trigynum TaxID=586398 RepID=A0AAV2GU19_9ROSI
MELVPCTPMDSNLPSTPDLLPSSSFSPIVTPPDIASHLTALPSLSCTQMSPTKNWDFNSYPFDEITLKSRSLDLGRRFNLISEENPEQDENIISEASRTTHRRKIRTSRSKLEMETFRLGPQVPPSSGPRRSRSKSKGWDDISNAN